MDHINRHQTNVGNTSNFHRGQRYTDKMVVGNTPTSHRGHLESSNQLLEIHVLTAVINTDYFNRDKIAICTT